MWNHEEKLIDTWNIWGVFKKRPNFAKGAQITIVSVIWLLHSLAAKFDNKLLFPEFHCMQYLLSYSFRSEPVYHMFGKSNYETGWGTTCVCVEFCFKLCKTLVETLNCWSKLTERNGGVIYNATSGLSISKRAEHQSVKTPGLDNLHGNRCLTVREVAEELSISVGSCHEILNG